MPFPLPPETPGRHSAPGSARVPFGRKVRFFAARRWAELLLARKLLLFLLVDVIALAFVRKGASDAVLLLKHDALGDYILCRNYLHALRAHPPYRGKKIVLCGSIVFRELAETYDRDVVDSFLWIDHRRFSTHPLARFRMLRQVKRLGASVALSPLRIHTFIETDALVRASGAPERIGFVTPSSRPAWTETSGWIDWNPHWLQALGSLCYTRLIPPPHSCFEFETNRAFFENVLGNTPLPARPTLEPLEVEVPTPSRPFAVLLPGAGEAIKEWPPENFGRIARHLVEKHGLAIVVAGTTADREKARRIEESSRVGSLDLTGALTLPQLTTLLSRSEIAVGNDSGGIHLAAAIGKRALGIATDTGLVHFHPYPAKWNSTVRFVHPSAVEESASPEIYLAQKSGSPRTSASEIGVSPVIEALDHVLANVRTIRAPG